MKVALHPTPIDLIESIYIYGLHKIARELAEVFRLNVEYARIVQKYSHQNQQFSFTTEEDQELAKVPGFINFESRVFLRSEAAMLPKSSNILEVGTL